jgi:hypothetical protein
MRALFIFILLSFGAVDASLEDRINSLIPALITVESGGDDLAVGDNGKAIGCLQIWKIVIMDVNRVYKTSYTYEERTHRLNSCEVCFLYLRYWGLVYERRVGKPASKEVLARIWNSGPNGYKKKVSEKYWAKVQKQLLINKEK